MPVPDRFLAPRMRGDPLDRQIDLDEANRTGRIKAGDYILMVVFGGGLTWASTVIEW